MSNTKGLKKVGFNTVVNFLFSLQDGLIVIIIIIIIIITFIEITFSYKKWFLKRIS